MDCILIINKNEFNLSETVRKLENSDIKILSTNKIDEAIKYTNNECIECIIFNVNELNDEDIDYVKQFKISKKTKLIPIIIVTTKINNEDKITDIINSGVLITYKTLTAYCYSEK
jgi:response regulator RpfG family c-di-GMP phosphodiesterase